MKTILTRAILKIKSREYVHTFGNIRSEASARQCLNETMSIGTELVRLENTAEDLREGKAVVK